MGTETPITQAGSGDESKRTFKRAERPGFLEKQRSGKKNKLSAKEEGL
jgi:hypothetical protein